ncbi:amidohydrolase family protein [Ilumatobacter sp.]|uniref:amidohydrolase family protein n=1 Tax=Ilumatobacter sp. TaxID=1967498 RepID=UPI003C353D8E
MKKIDVYSHILPPDYFSRMQEMITNPAVFKRWLELPNLHDIDARLEMLDEFGDDFQQILTLSSPPIERIANEQEAPAVARLANEAMRTLTVAQPSRFPHFVASLPMNNPTAAVEEAQFAIDKLGACGVQIFTNMNGVPVDDEQFLPLYDLMASYNLPIWMHPTRDASTPDFATEDRSEFEIWWAFGWPYETSAAMARMVFSGLFERHPDLKVITHHLGAMIPFFEGRIDTGWGQQLGSRTTGGALGSSISRPPIDYFRQFYADTAISGSAAATRCGLDFFGCEHVLFGSDCPFDPEGGPGFIRSMIRVIDELEITTADRTLIYEGNIMRLIRKRLTDR